MSSEDTGPKINPGDIILWPMLKLDYDTQPDKIAALLPPGIDASASRPASPAACRSHWVFQF